MHLSPQRNRKRNRLVFEIFQDSAFISPGGREPTNNKESLVIIRGADANSGKENNAGA